MPVGGGRGETARVGVREVTLCCNPHRSTPATNRPLPPPPRVACAASEAIAGGRLMGLPQAYVLLHARVTPTVIECRVKSGDAGLSAAFAQAVLARLR